MNLELTLPFGKVLSKITLHSGVRRAMTNMGGEYISYFILSNTDFLYCFKRCWNPFLGVELTIQALDSSSKHLQLYAAGTLANLAKYPRASSLVRRYGGLPKLVALLEINAEQYTSYEKGKLDEDDLPLDLQV